MAQEAQIDQMIMAEQMQTQAYQPAFVEVLHDKMHGAFEAVRNKLEGYAAPVLLSAAVLTGAAACGNVVEQTPVTVAATSTNENQAPGEKATMNGGVDAVIDAAHAGGTAVEADDNTALINALKINDVDPNICVDAVKKSGGQTTPFKDGKEIVTLQIGAKLPEDAADPMKRQWSDAVDRRLLTDKADTAGLENEIKGRICSDPEIAGMFATYIAQQKVNGIAVVDLNEWLKEYKAPEDGTDPYLTVNEKAAKYVPQMKDGLDTPEEVEAATDANFAFQEFAGKLVTILDNLSNQGNKDAGQTTMNVHLRLDGLQAGGIPQLSQAPDQYLANGDRSAVVFTITTKSGNECVLSFGFDTGDMRIEEFEEKKCEQPAPPTADTVPGNPGTPTESTPTPTKPGTPTTRPNITVTTVPGVTVTTGVGPKSNPKPPVTGGAPTTVEPGVPQENPNPTTAPTTAKPPTQPTQVPQNTTPTTKPGEGIPDPGLKANFAYTVSQ